MTTYRHVAVSGRVMQGPQQQQEQSTGDDRFNGSGGVRKEWWWQAGPVDSCCCCCSLRTGVGLLAVDALLIGVWTIFFMRAFYASIIEAALSQSQEQYLRTCSDFASTIPDDCEQLLETVRQVQGSREVILHLPTVIYVQDGFVVVAGAIGLWAVFFRSTRAAKVYMLMRLARFWLSAWVVLELRSLYIKYDMDQRHLGIVYLINNFCMLYYFKVSWSYYKERLGHENAHTGSRNDSSDMAYHLMPMVAVNTIV